MRGSVAAILSALALGACHDVGPPVPAVLNGWSNGLIGDLVAGALTSDRLGANEGITRLLRGNEAARSFLHYAVQCALPQGKGVTLEAGDPDLTFDGLIGLAPQWADGPCDRDCQEWVSACVLSRSNAYGVVVSISPQADHPALSGTRRELPAYPVEEGAFYGNLFAPTPRAYACRGRGYDPLYMTFRRCSQPGNACGIQNVGPCGDVDGDTGSASYRHACSARSADGVAYAACRSRATDPDTGEFPEPSQEYPHVVTIYLPRSSMGNSCDRRDPAVPGEPPGAAVPPLVAAGTPCTSDDECSSDTVFCNVQGPEAPFCTAECTESGDRSDEATQCGGSGSTCLTYSMGPTRVSRCTRACEPQLGTGGACAPAQICTGFWYTHGPEAPGCAPFCRDDADCIRGARCNPRAGACGLPVDEGLLEDGEPCAFDAPGPTCKGTCAPDGPFPAGVCASFIHLGRTRTCPYRPDSIRPVFAPAPDELAICAFRSCTGDADCTPPLRCVGPGTSGTCRHGGP